MRNVRIKIINRKKKRFFSALQLLPSQTFLTLIKQFFRAIRFAKKVLVHHKKVNCFVWNNIKHSAVFMCSKAKTFPEKFKINFEDESLKTREYILLQLTLSAISLHRLKCTETKKRTCCITNNFFRQFFCTNAVAAGQCLPVDQLDYCVASFLPRCLVAISADLKTSTRSWWRSWCRDRIRNVENPDSELDDESHCSLPWIAVQKQHE